MKTQQELAKLCGRKHPKREASEALEIW
jgi:hypothetical protein